MLSLFCLLFYLLFTATTACDDVFHEQPKFVLTAVGTQGKINCTVAPEFDVEWIITLPNGETIFSVELKDLKSLGITIQDSVLTVNRTKRINGTTIQCQAVLLTATSMRCLSEAVQVIFYGLSPLTTTENPPDPSTVTPPPSERPTVGAIVGGLIGAALIAVLVAVVILIWLRHEGHLPCCKDKGKSTETTETGA